ncbi:hypothetical protein EHQ12_05430 [Leptospira gomenensis]|uniref:Uncharacterized protein n=1 Tax=Leptospira gomenensis TaxID=2484974 RepID=A0A5F1YF59_9LEPT|nr:hypothetical protein [Leptospira gomenensis]TGK36397.1 hypothetical protein EHQ17_04130 [Leptospira gomenensis]TGK41933.1 hypothetical protein EHQ12_05430 [Leptospira gomenensis]TGK49525.1 hypothetical protein EHQ07_04925 [Leptospira gomenensis]TGK67575.1 hypothetical protein EHQ13_01840 [Leptospira gomenensis]
MNLAVFGLGYIGVRIHDRFRILRQQRADGEFRLSTFSSRTSVEGTERFDFSDPSDLLRFRKGITNENFDLGIVTFPVQKLKDPSAFFEVFFSKCKSGILLGTTSAYRRESEIFETTETSSDHERFITETEWLRRKGKLLRLSGIYGPGRNPADWIRKGLVRKNSRQLNLIHGEDVAFALSLLTFKIFEEGFETVPNVLNLSDNQWHTWKEIFSVLEENGKIPKSEPEESAKEDCFIDSSLIRNLLPDLQTKDFWRELENLEGIGDH